MLRTSTRVPPGEPVRVLPEEETWEELPDALAASGFAVVYARVADWTAGELDPDTAARMLGVDAPRYFGIGDAASRARFATSRCVLRRLISVAAGGDPAQFEIARQSNGRPYLRGYDQFELSVSHTGGIVVAGISTIGLIGVDIESNTRRVHSVELAERACTPRERSALARLAPCERPRELIRLWTLKEAYTKAIGLGLRLPFRFFGFVLDGGGQARPDPDANGFEAVGAENWMFQVHDIEGAYTVGLAAADGAFGGLRDTLGGTMIDSGLARAVLSDIGL